MFFIFCRNSSTDINIEIFFKDLQEKCSGGKRYGIEGLETVHLKSSQDNTKHQGIF